MRTRQTPGMSASEPVRLTFVCLGNICRSPTAEGIMAALVAGAGLADHIEIKAADLSNGLLSIDLLRVIPEEAKAKRIPINGTQKPALQH